MGKLFDGIWGDRRGLDSLERNIERDKVASAYLFTGPEGTGKTTAAITFARALLCRSEGEVRGGEGCSCRSCSMFRSASHPDFMAVVPTESKSKNENFKELVRDPSVIQEDAKGRSIKIDQVRELISAISLKSYMGGRKVALVTAPDMMNEDAANSFLKTLEEPPPDTVMVLVTSNQSALLPTVVSRCRVIRFVPMTGEELAGKLSALRGMPPEEASRLAVIAEGCPGRVLGGGAGRAAAISEEAEALLGGVLTMDSCEISKFSVDWKERRDDLPLLFQRMMEIIRLAASPQTVPASGRMASAMKALGSVPPARLVDGYFSLLEKGQLLVFNPNVQLFLESALFGLQSLFLKGEPLATA